MNLKNIYTCFPGGRYKVLTMSYDDGREEDRRLADIFNHNGIKATFHLNSGLCYEDNDDRRLRPSEWKQVYEGHEVSCHTMLHPALARCPIEQAALQILEDRRVLEEQVGYPVRGMSYPYGSYSNDIVNLLPKLGMEYSRVVGNTDSFEMPENYLLWKSTCHHNHNLLENGNRFLELDRPQLLHMMYVWGHSYEFPRDNNWDLMERFCQLMSGKKDIWYATNIQIVDYMNAAKNLKFTIHADKVYNPSAQSVWIQADNEIVEVPGGQTINLG